MSKLSIMALVFCLLFVVLAQAEEQPEQPKFDGSQLINNAGAKESTAKAAKRLNAIFKTYYDKLESARRVEARKGEVEEVVRIEEALEGEAVTDFTSYTAKNARERLDKSLADTLEDWRDDLERDVKKALVNGNTEEGIRMQAVIDEVDAALKNLAPSKSSRTSSGNKPIKFTVEADKDWQDTGIQLTKGTKVTWEASGTWGPGRRQRTSKRSWSKVTGDPDTYKVQAQVGGKKVGNGGTTWSFTAPKDGTLSLRMNTPNPGLRGDATGSVTVEISTEEPVTLKKDGGEEQIEDLETFTRRLFATGAVATAEEKKDGESTSGGGTARSIKFMLDASKGFQDTGVDLAMGEKVVITAMGKWTNGKKGKDGKPTYDTADRFKMVGAVGGSRLGRGPANWIFVAPIKGKLKLGMAGFGNYKKKGFEPKGHLALTIVIKPAP